MRLSDSDRIVLVAFAALAISSIGIKAAAGPPRDGFLVPPNQIATTLRKTLEAQGFSTSVIPLKMQSPIVLAKRGNCRLSARDARGGKPMITQFAHDAAAIGSVRYLYRGQAHDVPPGLRIRLGRLETEVLSRFRGRSVAHMPIALASSPECGAGNYGLEDVRVLV